MKPDRADEAANAAAVAAELASLPLPWDVRLLDQKLDTYNQRAEEVDAELAALVRENSEEFANAMTEVMTVEDEVNQLMILLKNGRRKLSEAQERLNGGLRIVQQQRRRARAEAVLEKLRPLQEAFAIAKQRAELVQGGSLGQAMSAHATLEFWPPLSGM
jgi:hypothetical protein